MTLAIVLHVLAAVVWVGGMFFAAVVLRPASVRVLEAPERLMLWLDVLKGFFLWVSIAILLLLTTGYVMVFGGFGGFSGAPVHVHIMHGTGLLMVAVFARLVASPFKRMRTLIEAEDWQAAGVQLAAVRRMVLANLGLGLLTVAVASSGRFGWLS